jgi:hypothetical protein
MSLLLALGCAAVVYRIAKEQKFRWPGLAGIFVLAQPLVFLHSFSELTELPFAALLGLTFWAYQNRRWGAVAVLTGLLPLGRPEGFGFLFLVAGALVLHRQWKWVPLLALGLAGWSYAGWELYGRATPVHRWLIDNWPYAAQSAYQPGSLFHFAMLLPAVTSPLIFPATVAGIWRCLREGAIRGDHLRRCRWLIAAIPLLILAGHSFLYWRGKMASSGELRYMLAVAPFWGLLAAAGWEWLFQSLRWRHAFACAAFASIFPALLNTRLHVGPLALGYKVLPLVQTEDWTQAQAITRWLNESGVREQYPRLMASHPAIFYYLDLSQSGPECREWRRPIVEAAPEGTILIWDPMYGIYNADAERSIPLEEIRRAGWIELNPFFGPNWKVFKSPKAAASFQAGGS